MSSFCDGWHASRSAPTGSHWIAQLVPWQWHTNQTGSLARCWPAIAAFAQCLGTSIPAQFTTLSQQCDPEHKHTSHPGLGGRPFPMPISCHCVLVGGPQRGYPGYSRIDRVLSITMQVDQLPLVAQPSHTPLRVQEGSGDLPPTLHIAWHSTLQQPTVATTTITPGRSASSQSATLPIRESPQCTAYNCE